MTRLLPFHRIYGGRWFLRRATYSTAKVDYIFAPLADKLPHFANIINKDFEKKDADQYDKCLVVLVIVKDTKFCVILFVILSPTLADIRNTFLLLVCSSVGL